MQIIGMDSGYPLDYSDNETAGRCHKCEVRFVWKRTKIRTLKTVRCPYCHGELKQTHYFWKGLSKYLKFERGERSK